MEERFDSSRIWVALGSTSVKVARHLFGSETTVDRYPVFTRAW